MLMPVPQTLAKKLNKDVFQGEREGEKERGDVHTERCWARISDTLQARDEARTGVCGKKRKKTRRRGKKRGEKPSIKSDKSKSASSTAALGEESRDEQAEEGMNRREKRWI